MAQASHTPSPTPEEGLSSPSGPSSPRRSTGLKKNTAIRRILSQEGIDALEPYGNVSSSGKRSSGMRREGERKNEEHLSDLWRKIMEANPNEYDRDSGALINHGPPIDHWNPKPNPTGPYGIGLSVPGETKLAAEVGRALTRADMISGLRWSFAHDPDEFHRLAFTTFFARNLGLNDASLLNNYAYLRYIYIPMNWLPDLKPFTGMKSLSLLDMSDNMVVGEQGDVPFIQTLEILSLAGNQLVDVSHIPENFYIYLNLNHNKLESLVGLFSDVYHNLETLEVRGNHIKTLGTLALPYLKHLWVADNELTSLKGIAGCTELVSIHARGNKIKSLFGFPHNLHKLQYVNLRNNTIEKLRYIRFLGRAPLQVVILIGNACRRVKGYNIEVLACIPTLVRLDKMKLTSCDLEAARFLREGRTNRTLPPMSSFLASATPPPSPRGDECLPLIDAQRDSEFWNKIRLLGKSGEQYLDVFEDEGMEEPKTSDLSTNEGGPVGPGGQKANGSKVVKN